MSAPKYTDLATDFTYLIPSEQDHEFGCVVNTVGLQSIRANTPYPVQGHPSGYHFNVAQGRVLREYQLLYISGGQGYFSSPRTRQQPIGKGNLLLLVPGEWHTYHPDPHTGWNEYYIGFEGKTIDNIFEKGILRKESTVIEVGFNDDLVKHYQQAIQLARADKRSTQQYLAGIVTYLIGMVCYISRNSISEPGQIEQKIIQAKVIMQENIFKEIDPETIARELNLSYSWFRKEFKNYTGHSPAKYFQELKIGKAKELLLTTSRSVKEIAFMLGYGSTGYFSVLFKKCAGHTPLDYRFGRGEVKR
ncbi:MAG: AraC family transcriptional regulator [Odoribacteraceae bacterium]|jgi:AraC-like DNA-binding protein|nr:AraC family transcriptional regulator [Odoribacteraceae bacterium]